MFRGKRKLDERSFELVVRDNKIATTLLDFFLNENSSDQIAEYLLVLQLHFDSSEDILSIFNK